MAHPRVTIQVGNRVYPALAERVSPEQGAQILQAYARQHLLALRKLARIMHYPLDGSGAADGEASAMSFGRKVTILAFRTNPTHLPI